MLLLLLLLLLLHTNIIYMLWAVQLEWSTYYYGELNTRGKM